MTHVYRLAIQYPKLWLGPGGAPGTVRAAVAAAPGVLETEFLTRTGAHEVGKFWRLQGAEVVIVKSDPVTWPDGSPS